MSSSSFAHTPNESASKSKKKNNIYSAFSSYDHPFLTGRERTLACKERAILDGDFFHSD